MARFYFHMRTGDHVEIDTDGTELPGLTAAKDEALHSAREILADAIRASRHPVDALVIADDSGRELETVSLKDVLPKGLG
jgi:hypothetical protein